MLIQSPLKEEQSSIDDLLCTFYRKYEFLHIVSTYHESFLRYRAIADLTFGGFYDQINAHKIAFFVILIYY